MTLTTQHTGARLSRLCLMLIGSLVVVVFSTSETAAQWNRRLTRINDSFKLDARTLRRGNQIDEARSNLFTDFSDNVRITASVPELQLSDSQSSGRMWRLTSGSSAPGAFNIYDNNAGQFRLTIDTAGNVGIGETSPTRSLTVRKDVANGVGAGIYLQNNQYANNSGAETEVVFGHLQSGGNPLRYAKIHSLGADPYGSVNSFSFGLTDNTDTYRDRLTILQNGNIGLGETAPTRPLTIKKDVANGVGAGIYLQNNQYANNRGAETEIIFGHLQSGGTMRYAKIHSLGADPYGSVNSFSFGITDSTDTYRDRLTILQNGNIGIGEPSPGSRLDVNGNTNVTGNITVTASGTGTGNITAAGTIEAGNIRAKYQDVAEWVPSSERLTAGTVVVLDSTKSNQVTSSSVSYDTRVAGVISEQPGIALGEKSEGKVLVATTGRVRVKVDASKGAIHIGDLLVTSDISGVAMKSEPVEFAGRKMHMPGTLIGKALEPLVKGKGTILVLLSLQ